MPCHLGLTGYIFDNACSFTIRRPLFGFCMNHPQIDIIIPLWNRPDETRRCLTNVVKHTPEARFVLLDNASERETETLLHDFADGLGDQVLLFRYEKVLESVALANEGLAKADAPVMVLLAPGTLVGNGWLTPMLQVLESRPDAGLVVPLLVNDPAAKILPGPIEVTRTEFSAVLIRGEMYRRIGGFDHELDGGPWCLRDYSRRAWQNGFTTIAVPGVALSPERAVPLGSESRREERTKRSRAEYVSRWGADRAYCIDLSAAGGAGVIVPCLAPMLEEARCGHTFTILAPAPAYAEIIKKGYNTLHENIVVERLPRLFRSRAAGRIRQRLGRSNPEIKVITDPVNFFRSKGTAVEADSATGGPNAE